MNPKEKAKEFVRQFYSIGANECKQCASIAVDEILEAIEWHEYETPNKEIRFWIQVKQEINNL